MRKPEVCILPVAGLSTRNLPATKALHKGFLTLHSLPIIQYAVNACAEIGIKEVVFIYSDQSCKHLFESYFSPYPWLENHLREKNKLDLLKAVQEVIPAGMKFSFAEQAEPKGNGHAILMAKDVVGDRDFIVMWPDDVYINLHGDGVLKQLLDVYEKEGGMVEISWNFRASKWFDMVLWSERFVTDALSEPKGWLRSRLWKTFLPIMPVWGRIFCRMKLCRFCRKFAREQTEKLI